MSEILKIIAGLISLIAYYFLYKAILKNKAAQNFTAFILWAVLSTIATVTIYLESGNFWLPLGNALGEISIAILLLTKKQIRWAGVETLATILVFICLAVWFLAGQKAGILATGLATIIASIPQMVSTFKKPALTPSGIYVGFLIASVAALLAGESWTVAERFFPACAVFLCSIITGLSIIHWSNSDGFIVIAKHRKVTFEN